MSRNKISKISKSRKSQAFIVGVIMIIIWGLITSFIIMHFIYQDKTEDEHLGTYQSGMIAAITDGDNAYSYLDQTVKYSSQIALQKFADKGGTIDPTGSNADTSSMEPCGKYVYNLWSSETDECYPEYADALGYLLDDELNNELAGSTVQELKKTTSREYYIEPELKNSLLRGISDDKYNFIVYKNKEIKNSLVSGPTTSTYVQNKVLYTGTDNGDIQGIPFLDGSKAPRNGKAITMLVIHYTAGNSIQGALDAWKSRPGVGAQYVLGSTRDNYQLIQYSADKYSVGHAGCPISRGTYVSACMKPEYNNVVNKESIGIEVVNLGYACKDVASCKNDPTRQVCGLVDFKGGPAYCWEKYPDKQMEKLVALSALLVKRYNIPLDRQHILGHEDVTKDKVDPGPAFDWNTFMKRVSDASKLDESTLISTLNDGKTSSVSSMISTGCQIKDNDKWKITNLKVSTGAISNQLTADQKFTIVMSVENDGAECAAIRANPQIQVVNGLTDRNIFTNSNKAEFWPYTQNTVEVQIANNYLRLGQPAYLDTQAIECSFLTDAAKVKEQQSIGNCVLLAPTSDTKIKYRITAYAKDAMNSVRAADPAIYKDIEVSKPTAIASGATTNTGSANSATSGQGASAAVTLTKDEQNNFDATQKNIEQQKLMPIIEKYAAKYNIPKPVILGKITVETGAKPVYASKCNAYDACGISQVVYSIHGSPGGSIEKACGKFYTRDQFLQDKDCQINAGAYILKSYYDSYGTKNKVQVPVCLQTPDKKTYTGWEAALRAYNGLGKQVMACKDPLDQHNYVPLVMKYATAWGYSSTTATVITQYQTTAVDEVVGKGIIGLYSIYPSFSVDVPYDFRLMDNLTEYMKWASDMCRTSTLDRESCLANVINDFNKNVSSGYINRGIYVNLNRSCDSTPEEKSFSGFIESLEQCSASPDYNCRCKMNRTAPFTDIKMEGDDGYTTFYYKDAEGEKSAESYVNFFMPDKSPLSAIDYTSMKNIYVLKRLGYMVLDSPNMRICDSVTNKYRMCLKTNYTTEEFSDSKFIKQNVTMKFAITIRDSEPPPPITGMNVLNKKYSDRSVIVSFDESTNDKGQKVTDVGTYRVYLADNDALFSAAMSAIRGVLTNYRTIDIKNSGYTTYKDMDIMQEPECVIKDDGNGKYCVFNYAVTDVDGTAKKIILEDNKAYYLSDKKKFVYVISGTDATNKMIDNAQKYILVTAIDIDGNEIDNVNAKQKIIKGQNLLMITPEDQVAPGLVTIKDLTWDIATRTKLTLTFDRPKIYIDGRTLDANTPIIYQTYNMFVCNNVNNANGLCMVQPPYASIAETPASTDASLSEEILITKLLSSTGLGTIALIDKGGGNFKQYYYTFTEDAATAIVK